MNTQYSIYQINSDRDKYGVRFLGSSILKLVLGKFEVDPAIYDKVYDGECGRLDSLEGIYNSQYASSGRLQVPELVGIGCS